MTPPPRYTAELLAQAGSLRKLARVLVGDRPEADDLVQDTLAFALESPVEGEGIGAWLRGVLRKKASHRRREAVARKRREQKGARAEEVPGTADLVARKTQLAALVEEVLDLPEPYQTVLYLRYFEDKGPKAIARQLELKEGTVASQVHRGIDLLRERLDARAGGDRSAWVGAFLPWFSMEATNSTLTGGGLLMAGKLKLLAAIAALGGLLLYVADQELPALQDAALAPSETSGPLMERVAMETRPVLEVESVEPNEPEVPALEEKPLDEEPAYELEIDADRMRRLRDLGYTQAEPLTNTSSAPPRPVDQVVSRSFDLTMTFEEDPNQGIMEDLGDNRFRLNYDFVFAQEIEASDTYVGDPGALSQNFDRHIVASWTSAAPDDLRLPSEETQLMLGESPLNNRHLSFRWNDVASDYGVTFRDERKTDRSQSLAQVEADMDLREFAPPEHTTDGQSWTVPMSALDKLLNPGGDLQVVFEDDQGSKIGTEGLWSFIIAKDPSANPDDHCTLKSLGIEDTVHGPSHAFGIEFQLSRSIHHDSSAPEAPTEDGNIHSVFTFVAKGSGRWDAADQRVTELDIEGSATSRSTTLMANDQSIEVYFEGRLEISVENRVTSER